ncbi:MAG TPA: putative peptidoglycan glycosyltransferase FtsW [Candidatus Nitrosopolaris sp.]|nr:putative peptidoglycan glycosyltransferase FtsW [Candidatus Nitrosopolaris sp.]
MDRRPRHSPSRALMNAQADHRTAVGLLGRKHKPDYWILILASLLVTVGLVVVYSISPGLAASQNISQNYYITKQLIDVGLGIGIFALAAYIPLGNWHKLGRPLAIAALIGCLVVMITPLNAVYPAHRWIRLGSFSFQIAELIKLSLIIWLAGFLSRQWRAGKLADFNSTLKPLLFLILGLGIVVAKLQSDFGSAAVMVAIIILMAYVAGIPLKKTAIILSVIVALLSILIISTPYRRERITAFLHPQTNCQGSGYQACQDLISVGSGGVLGLGLGYSVQAYGYTPEASNDSIFAIIAEEVGFVGSMIIVVIYGVFISRLKRVIEHSADQFNRLVTVGVLAWLSTQMIINIGAMVGLLPLKGITLPLISQGGTSLVFLAAALGLVFQISRYTSYDVSEPSQNSASQAGAGNYPNRWGVRRPHHAPLVARPRT